MTTDFGEARMGKTKYGGECILHEVQGDKGGFLIFTIKKKYASSGKIAWQCAGCHRLKRQQRDRPNVPLVLTDKGRLLKNPETPGHAHYCELEPKAEVEAQQILHEVKDEVKQGTKKPRAAYRGSLVDASKRFGTDPAFRENVKDSIPDYKSVKTSLYRAYNDRFPVIKTMDDIPEDLLLTLDGKYEENAGGKDESSLIFRQANPPFLIMGSRQDLAVLHKSHYWLYVVMGFINGEGVATVHALMPDRTEVSYTTLFSKLRDALNAEFGNIGQVTACHFDFEKAAISGFRSAFPTPVVKCCVFHFAQAIIRNLTSRGLKAVYDNRENVPAWRCVRVWVRRLTALSLLRPDLIVAYWERVLQYPPSTGNPAIDQKLNLFATAYFAKQWINNQQHLDLMCHFGHSGPRTNNAVEGYNNSLSTKFLRKHPQFSIFLVEYQEFHHEALVRGRKLIGGAAPADRLLVYIQNDASIDQAQLRFNDHINGLDSYDPYYDTNCERFICTYLDEIQALLG